MDDRSLLETHSLKGSSLFNEDLAPVPAIRRTWGFWNFAALWISMSACIPTYMLASSLIGGGMNWSQAVLTIFLGNVIVLIPMVLNAHAGTRYGIVPGVVRYHRGQRPGRLAGAGGLRLVRHPDMARR